MGPGFVEGNSKWVKGEGGVSFTCDGNGGPLHAAVLDALWAVLDGVGGVAVGSTERASVGTEHRAGDFIVGVLQVVRGVEAHRFAVVSTEHARLRLLHE